MLLLQNALSAAEVPVLGDAIGIGDSGGDLEGQSVDLGVASRPLLTQHEEDVLSHSVLIDHLL